MTTDTGAIVRSEYNRTIRNKLTDTTCVIAISQWTSGIVYFHIYMEKKTYMYYQSMCNVESAKDYINNIKPLTEFERYNYINYSCNLSRKLTYQELYGFVKSIPEEVEDVALLVDTYIHNLNSGDGSPPYRSHPMSVFHVVEAEKGKAREHLAEYFTLPKENYWWVLNLLSEFLYKLTEIHPDNGGVEPQNLSWLKFLEKHTIDGIIAEAKKAEEQYWLKQPS